MLETLELNFLNKFNNTFFFYKRYGDDYLLIVNQDKIKTILTVFNSYNNELQIKVKQENNNIINYLDIKFIRFQDNKLETN